MMPACLKLDRQTVNGIEASVDVNHGFDNDGKENHLWVTPARSPADDYTYGYDTMGRFETITPTGSNLAFQDDYDAASNEIQRHNYLSNPQLDQFYYRDELDRMWRLEVKKGATLLGRENYAYDAMSRLGSVTREDNKQDQFGYYRDGELNWVLGRHFAYALSIAHPNSTAGIAHTNGTTWIAHTDTARRTSGHAHALLRAAAPIVRTR